MVTVKIAAIASVSAWDRSSTVGFFLACGGSKRSLGSLAASSRRFEAVLMRTRRRDRLFLLLLFRRLKAYLLLLASVPSRLPVPILSTFRLAFSYGWIGAHFRNRLIEKTGRCLNGQISSLGSERHFLTAIIKLVRRNRNVWWLLWLRCLQSCTATLTCLLNRLLLFRCRVLAALIVVFLLVVAFALWLASGLRCGSLRLRFGHGLRRRRLMSCSLWVITIRHICFVQKT